jgi:hypothetical protein
MNMVEEFEYEGYMSQKAQDFFKGKLAVEQRDGVPTIGSFVILASGNTHLPSKGDVFRKYENGSICVSSKHRP